MRRSGTARHKSDEILCMGKFEVFAMEAVRSKRLV
jgi:hypothetical protein